MPVCYITLSEMVKEPNVAEIDSIKDFVAEGLISKARYARHLDRNHIVVRIQKSQRCHMLGEIEIDIFAQFDFQRYFSRDRRAKSISSQVSKLLKNDCATWINLSMVGYARVTKDGKTYFSD